MLLAVLWIVFLFVVLVGPRPVSSRLTKFKYHIDDIQPENNINFDPGTIHQECSSTHEMKMSYILVMYMYTQVYTM